jgi:hypothetical protein
VKPFPPLAGLAPARKRAWQPGAADRHGRRRRARVAARARRVRHDSPGSFRAARAPAGPSPRCCRDGSQCSQAWSRAQVPAGADCGKGDSRQRRGPGSPRRASATCHRLPRATSPCHRRPSRSQKHGMQRSPALPAARCEAARPRDSSCNPHWARAGRAENRHGTARRAPQWARQRATHGPACASATATRRHHSGGTRRRRSSRWRRAPADPPRGSPWPMRSGADCDPAACGTPGMRFRRAFLSGPSRHGLDGIRCNSQTRCERVPFRGVLRFPGRRWQTRQPQERARWPPSRPSVASVDGASLAHPTAEDQGQKPKARHRCRPYGHVTEPPAHCVIGRHLGLPPAHP